MKLIKTTDAIGHVLCHDLTQIIVGVTKDARFRKGHVVSEEDIPVLLSMGKEFLYVWENDSSSMHEDDGARILRDICINGFMEESEIKEGKIELTATCRGLLRVDVERLFSINMLGEIMIATRNSNAPVEVGDTLAGMRVIPLVVSKQKMRDVQSIAGKTPLLAILPYIHHRCGIVVTGHEVLTGRIQDTFTPVVTKKLMNFGAEILGHDTDNIRRGIEDFAAQGASMILCTGGMSVDPDDRTPAAIKATGAEIICYGAPVLPGAMFLLSYLNGIPVLGLPGCVMYSRRTAFDLVLPSLMAGIRLTSEDIARLGNGGLCLGCDECRYPNCGFGKGMAR